MNLLLTIIDIFVYKKFIILFCYYPFFHPKIHIRFTQECYYIDVKGRDLPEARL